jgi:hypothetical protein
MRNDFKMIVFKQLTISNMKQGTAMNARDSENYLPISRSSSDLK